MHFDAHSCKLKTMKNNLQLSYLTVPLFVSLLIVSAYIRIPLPPVPITLQTMIFMIMALTLSPNDNLKVYLLWLFLGLIGIPAFTSGGGIAPLMGPTAGYIWIMGPGAMIVSAIRNRVNINGYILLFLYNFLVYLSGSLYLSYALSISLDKAIMISCVPFLAGDALKAIIALKVSKRLHEEKETIFMIA